MRACTICGDAGNRTACDRALLRGASVRSLAARFGTSSSTVQRHRKHLKASIQAAAAERAEGRLNRVSPLDVLGELSAIRADVRRVQTLAGRAGALNTVLYALDRRLKVLELQAKLIAGDLDEPRLRSNEVHFHLDENQARRVAEVFLQRHRTLELSVQRADSSTKTLVCSES